jgi:hypothetical protein
MSRAILAAALLLFVPATAHAAPPSVMPYEAIAAAWPGERPTFSMGRFSPDGSQLAFVAGQLAGASDQAWLYDLRTGRLVALSDAPLRERLSIEIKDMAWGADGALYVLGGEDRSDGYGVKAFQLVEAAGRVAPVAILPKDVAAAVKYDARPDIGDGTTFQRTYEDARFVVTVRDVRHPDYRLTYRRKGGGKVRLIANGSGALEGFLFDRSRSLVRYIDDIRHAIVSFDLNTGKAQTLFTFEPAELNLLDATADGKLLAYERIGPCDASASPSAADHYNICFLTLAP